MGWGSCGVHHLAEATFGFRDHLGRAVGITKGILLISNRKDEHTEVEQGNPVLIVGSVPASQSFLSGSCTIYSGTFSAWGLYWSCAHSCAASLSLHHGGRLQEGGILLLLTPQGSHPPQHPTPVSLGLVLLGVGVCSQLLPGPAKHLGESASSPGLLLCVVLSPALLAGRVQLLLTLTLYFWLNFCSLPLCCSFPSHSLSFPRSMSTRGPAQLSALPPIADLPPNPDLPQQGSAR